MKKPLVGILTYRAGTVFNEGAYFRSLIAKGRSMGIVVFIFSPQDVDVAAKKVKGYVPALGKGWREKWFAWPDVVIDQYRYYPLQKHKDYLPFRQQPLFLYTNSRFANKWRVHHVLAQDEQMRRWLPETKIYSKENVANMLKRHSLLYIKPTHGSGGRSILCVEKRPQRYVLRGRTKQQGTQLFTTHSKNQLLQRLNQWVRKQKKGNELFFVQQGLHLDLLPQRTVDTRLLIQKNGEGEWKTTGMGVRIGEARSSTSNLHGGGKAVPADRFFISRFGSDKAKEIISECVQLAHRAVNVIEEHYGQMMEFGLDIGVDVEGRVWLIETNPKPGREILRKTGQLDRYELAVQRPLEYAVSLVRRHSEETLAKQYEA